MLSKKYKIPRDEFPKNKAKANFYNSQHLTLVVRKSEKHHKNTKFSFIISKKIARNAVLRNKMKRRGYYAIQKIIKNTKENLLAVFILKKEIQTIPYRQFEYQILQLLKKAKIINN